MSGGRFKKAISIIFMGVPEAPETPTPESKSLDALYRLTIGAGISGKATESNTDPTFKSPIVVTQSHRPHEITLGNFTLVAAEHHEIEYSMGDKFWDWGTLEIQADGRVLCKASGSIFGKPSWNISSGAIPKELALF